MTLFLTTKLRKAFALCREIIRLNRQISRAQAMYHDAIIFSNRYAKVEAQFEIRELEHQRKQLLEQLTKM